MTMIVIIRSKKYLTKTLCVYVDNFFINLLGRAFKVMKNGLYFVVIAFSVAELLGILICASWMACDVETGTQE